MTTLKQMIDAAKRAAHEGRMDIVEATLARMERHIDRMEVPALQDVEKAAKVIEDEIDKATPPDQPLTLAGRLRPDVADLIDVDRGIAKIVTSKDDIAAGTSVEPDPPFDDAPEPMGDGIADAEGI